MSATHCENGLNCNETSAASSLEHMTASALAAVASNKHKPPIGPHSTQCSAHECSNNVQCSSPEVARQPHSFECFPNSGVEVEPSTHSCSDQPIRTQPLFGSSNDTSLFVYNCASVKLELDSNEVEVMPLSVKSAKIKADFQWQQISAAADIKPLEGVLTVARESSPVHVKKERVRNAVAVDTLGNAVEKETPFVHLSVAAKELSEATSVATSTVQSTTALLDSKADLEVTKSIMAPATCSSVKQAPFAYLHNEANVNVSVAIPLCIKQECLSAFEQVAKLNKSAKTLSSHIKQEYIIPQRQDGPLTRLRAKTEAVFHESNAAFKLETSAQLVNPNNELKYEVDDNNDSGIKSETESDLNCANLSAAHVKEETTIADDCVKTKTPTWMVQMLHATTKTEPSNVHTSSNSGNAKLLRRSQVKVAQRQHVLQKQRFLNKTSETKLQRKLKQRNERNPHTRLTRSKFPNCRLTTRNASTTAANALQLYYAEFQSPTHITKPKQRRRLKVAPKQLKLQPNTRSGNSTRNAALQCRTLQSPVYKSIQPIQKRRFKTMPKQAQIKTNTRSCNLHLKPSLPTGTTTNPLSRMQPKVRIKRLKSLNYDTSNAAARNYNLRPLNYNLRPLNIKLEVEKSCDFYDSTGSVTSRRLTRSAKIIKQENVSPRRRNSASRTLETVAKIPLPRIKNAYSLQPVVRLKRLKFNNYRTTDSAQIKVENVSDSSRTTSLNLSQTKVEQVELEETVLIAEQQQQRDDSGISLSESPSCSTNHSDKAAARDRTDSSNIADEHSIFKDNVLFEIALERAMINTLLLQHGHAPVQFQLYNNIDELKIFLDYLLGKC